MSDQPVRLVPEPVLRRAVDLLAGAVHPTATWQQVHEVLAALASAEVKAPRRRPAPPTAGTATGDSGQS